MIFKQTINIIYYLASVLFIYDGLYLFVNNPRVKVRLEDLIDEEILYMCRLPRSAVKVLQQWKILGRFLILGKT